MKKQWKRKLHQGIFSTALCLLCALVCVLTVVAGDELESKYDAQLDFSYNAITTQGEVTQNVLSALSRDVHVYAVFSDGSEDAQLMSLLNRYQAASEHLTWSQENLTRNPLLLKLTSSSSDDSAVTSDCLVIRCEETGRTRVLSGEDYIEYSYNSESGTYEVTGWTYEKSITEAILYVTSDDLPGLQILSGHGELTSSETAVMEEYLISNNYAVNRVNILSGDTLDVSQPLMILCPTKDLTDAELTVLCSFASEGGDLFIASAYTDPDDLTNFLAFYRLYGFEPIPGLVLADTDEEGTYYESSPNLLPEMLITDATGVLVTAGCDTVLMAGARAFEMPDNQTEDLTTYVALQSGNGSYIRTLSGADYITVEKQEGDRTGPFALALCADRGFDGGLRSRAFIIGNASMFTDEWMYSYTYSGELLLQVLQYLQGKAAVNLDIVARTAVREPLSFTNAAAPVVLLTLLPLMIAVLALAILRPRKNL